MRRPPPPNDEEGSLDDEEEVSASEEAGDEGGAGEEGPAAGPELTPLAAAQLTDSFLEGGHSYEARYAACRAAPRLADPRACASPLCRHCLLRRCCGRPPGGRRTRHCCRTQWTRCARSCKVHRKLRCRCDLRQN
jgi:hypothetical protein